jgi:release factor glutamine methyltransferase
MGTGCGIAAIIAAQRAAEVLGVDINPKAVAAARSNAELNGVARRTTFKKSDLFDAVDGRFDLVVFHPPYRWFKPRDLLEMSTTDENYQALTRFMREVGRHLAPGGRILLQFATSGDLDYLRYLIDQQGFKREVVATDRVIAERLPITYYVYRLTDPLRRADDNEGIEVSRRRRRQRPPEARAG